MPFGRAGLTKIFKDISKIILVVKTLCQYGGDIHLYLISKLTNTQISYLAKVIRTALFLHGVHVNSNIRDERRRDASVKSPCPAQYLHFAKHGSDNRKSKGICERSA